MKKFYLARKNLVILFLIILSLPGFAASLESSFIEDKQYSTKHSAGWGFKSLLWRGLTGILALGHTAFAEFKEGEEAFKRGDFEAAKRQFAANTDPLSIVYMAATEESFYSIFKTDPSGEFVIPTAAVKATRDCRSTNFICDTLWSRWHVSGSVDSWEDGFETIQKYANMRQPYAQFSLGLIYEGRIFSERPSNITEAYRWYQNASNLGFKVATKHLHRLKRNAQQGRYCQKLPDDAYSLGFTLSALGEIVNSFSTSQDPADDRVPDKLMDDYKYRATDFLPELRVKYLRKASILGDIDMSHQLAEELICKNTHSEKEGLCYFNLAAERGVMEAQYQLGMLRLTGSAQAAVRVRSAEYLFESSRRCSIHKEDMNPIEGIKLLENAADKGHVEALHKLAEIYATGNDIRKKNIVQSIKLYKKAVSILSLLDTSQKTKLKHFYERLGDLYLEIENPDQTFEWYKKADDISESNDQKAKATLYRKIAKLFGATNISKAVEWYSKAAAQGSLNAYYGIGELYESNGEIEEALKWYENGCTHKSELSCFVLGELYRFGLHGYKQNIDESFKYYKLGIELLGGKWVHIPGYWDKWDLEWYRWGFWWQGLHMEELFEYIGFNYENGLNGYPKDKAKAIGWYYLSADLGSKYAVAHLDRVDPNFFRKKWRGMKYCNSFSNKCTTEKREASSYFIDKRIL